MNHNEIRSKLNDFVDGVLSPDLVSEVDRHLQTCAECRSTVAGIRSLLSDTASLPRSIEPPRDLWGAIARRMERPRPGFRTLWSVRYALAAATVVLIAVTAATTVLVLGNRAAAPERVARRSPELAYLVRWVETEAEYLRAVAQLEEALKAARGRLAPTTVALLEKNRLIIEAAIEESRAALAADPGNREVMQTLATVYEKKLEMLQQVARLTSAP